MKTENIVQYVLRLTVTLLVITGVVAAALAGVNAITKDLYPTVAKHFGTSSSKVERAIRHAIDVAWNRGQMENINMLFGSRLYIKHDKPTHGEFIAMIADRLAIERSA